MPAIKQRHKNDVAVAGYELEALERHLPELEATVASAIDEMNTSGLIRQPLEIFSNIQNALAEVRGGVALARSALEQVSKEVS
ncbi:MAG: hypothetical protein RLO50_02275 [Azospirillaceae bacterium]